MSPEHRAFLPLEQGKMLAPPDRAIGELAARQHGVVAVRQLPALGVTPAMVETRRRNGHLDAMHRGVVAVGHARLRREGFWLAAVLAIGDQAVLSHRDGAALHELRPVGARQTVDVATRPIAGACRGSESTAGSG